MLAIQTEWQKEMYKKYESMLAQFYAWVQHTAQMPILCNLMYVITCIVPDEYGKGKIKFSIISWFSQGSALLYVVQFLLR